ncbi:MAG: DUF255 domain-containing protein [Planctomycetes bacterium]|nr:DUF255 domain-containing protein [Planctomycetota bacterium]
MSTRRILSLTAAALCLLSSLTEVQADSVKWRNNVDAAKIEAAQTGKLVLLHFWSTSCGPCKHLDRDVFSQPQVGQLLEQHFVPVKISADISPALAGSFNIDRVPTDVVLSPQGNVVAKLSCPPTALGYSTQLLNLAQHYRQQLAKHNTPSQAPVQSAYAGLKIGQYNSGAIATVPASASQAPVSPPQTAVIPASQPQVTHNAYVSAAANPQAPGQVVTAAPSRYGSQQVAAAASQAAPAQPAAVQMTSSQTPVPPQQQITVPPTSTAIATTTTTQKAESKTALPIKLPEGSPPLAFEGYCPSTLKHARKWVPGDLKYGAIHRGRTYLFTGETQRQQFLANPDAYSPVFSGIDPVKLLDENQTVEGSRKFGYEYRGAFYLFASQATMTRFASQPDQYAAGVRQAMTRMDGLGSTMRR